MRTRGFYPRFLIFVQYFVNLTIDVSFSCVCPLIDHEFRHNIVKVAVDPQTVRLSALARCRIA